MAKLTKEVQKVVRAAEKQGWRVRETKKGWMLYAPDGQHMETLHKTPSDWRSIRNTVARMRRHGFKWEGR
jgi:hypothetical protein